MSPMNMSWLFYTKWEDPTIVFYSARKDKDDYVDR